MKFGPVVFKDKIEREVILRNAEVEDASKLIDYLKITTGETPFLIREPEEVTITVEQEQTFIRSKLKDPDEVMLIAMIDEKHVGNCSLMKIGNYRRYAHRCDVAIALYQEYCGYGIGNKMLEIVLTLAKEVGYEQAELEVVANNETAISLYKKLGFKEYGRFPNNMKYDNGKYADAIWMAKQL